MAEVTLAAFVLGLIGGLKLGPLGVYVIHVTLTRSDKAGFFASFAPFVSDGPIILLVLLILSQGQHFNYFITGLSFAGAAYLVYLAIKILLSSNRINITTKDMPSSFMTAVKLNLMNPYPYLFWGTAGGAYLLRGDAVDGAMFIFVMLGTLAITKFSMAKLIKTLGKRFNARAYALLLKLLAVMLFGFAVKLGLDGVHLLQSGN